MTKKTRGRFTRGRPLICLLLIITMLLGDGFGTVKADSVDHTHIWATTYDSTNHWEYCTICGEKRNVTAHTFTDHWYVDNNSCGGKSSNKTCVCGYSYTYKKSHSLGTSWNSHTYYERVHVLKCSTCGSWMQQQACRNENGILSCKNPGKCSICGGNYPAGRHEINKNGVCNMCGHKFFSLSEPSVTYNNDYSNAYITFNVYPTDSSVEVAGTKMSSNSMTSAGMHDNGSYVKNDDGSYTVTLAVAIYNTNQKATVTWNYDNIKINGIFSTVISGITATIWRDHTAPVQNDVIQTDQASNNGWATIKQLTLSGTEDFSDIIWLNISDKSTGEKYLKNAAVNVVDNKYSYTCIPAIEGDTSGRTYVVTATDRIGNSSTKEFTVQQTDGSAPALKSGTSLNYTNWTRTKNISLSFYDFGAGGVQASLDNQTSYTALTKSGEYYIWNHTFGNHIGTTEHKLYVKDALGNATVYTLTEGNTDDTVYTITYNLNGGSTGTTLKTTYTVEDSFALPSDLSKTGYTMKGWTGSNGATANKNVSIGVGTRGNLTYTAQWQVNTYTNEIKHWLWGFNGEGNNSDKTAFNLSNTTFSIPYNSKYSMDATRAVKIPNGCYLRHEFEMTITSGSWNVFTMGKSLTQSAQNEKFEYDYAPSNYSITYNLNGGTNSSSNPSTYNVLYGVNLSAPTRPGYNFDGWYENLFKEKDVIISNDAVVDGSKITFTNSTSGNILDAGQIQLWNQLWNYSDYLCGIVTSGNSCNKTYTHNYDTGTYYIRVKANGTTKDSSVYYPVYLEKGKTYKCGFTIDEKSSDKIVMSGVYFTSTDKVTGINEGCNATFSSPDDLYAQLAKRTTGNVDLVAQWVYNPIQVKVPQTIIADQNGNSQFKVSCNDIKAGSIEINMPTGFGYTQSGKADVAATISNKSGGNIISPRNKTCVYNVTTSKGLSAGSWQGSFNIGLTLTKE